MRPPDDRKPFSLQRELTYTGVILLLLVLGVSAFIRLHHPPQYVAVPTKKGKAAGADGNSGSPVSNLNEGDGVPEQGTVVIHEAGETEVKAFCGACHAFPPPSSFPKWAWRRQVLNGHDFFKKSKLKLTEPSAERVIKWYENRAPQKMVLPKIVEAPGPSPVRFEKTGYKAPFFPESPEEAAARKKSPPSQGHTAPPPPYIDFPTVTNVAIGHLFHPSKLDIVVSDMKHGVMVLSPYEKAPRMRVLSKQPQPAHTEVADLNGDGTQDVLVANLGEFYPTDKPVGSVVWLKGNKDGTFTPFTLLKGVLRTADVQMADFNRDGRKDLVVAVFGAGSTGAIIYLENQTRDWKKPLFVPHILDTRAGTINVPVCDLNNDGKPDFVALISQEHETVVAFLNRGGGRFEKKTLFNAPHPAYGSSGIQIADMNNDGRLDVLYSNGDVLDRPHMLRPDYSIQWLENKGGMHFVRHLIAPMQGVERAVAADFNNDGLLDVVGASFLPVEFFDRPKDANLDAIVWMEQASPGKFARHVLEKNANDHVTCVAGDVDGDGKADFITGNLYLSSFWLDASSPANAITIWKNQGLASHPQNLHDNVKSPPRH